MEPKTCTIKGQTFYVVYIGIIFEERPTKVFIDVERYGRGKIRTIQRQINGEWLAKTEFLYKTLPEYLYATEEEYVSPLSH